MRSNNSATSCSSRLPQVGAKFKKGDAAAVVESVKAASDVFAPASGEVVAVNDKLAASPSLVNEDAQGQGWLFKLKLSAPGGARRPDGR